MVQQKAIPIEVVSLLPVLNDKLISLLGSLTPADWAKPTVAKLWTVKDVIAHLLDGNIRMLSLLRDNYYGEKHDIANGTLLGFLNDLNADWVKAMKRVSPQMLILLHEATGYAYCEYYASLDPFARSPFSVDWTGETASLNWMHIAREYTEKWLHQQQVRDAIGDAGLMTKELFYPFINIFMLALPYTYRNVHAIDGTAIRISIPGEIGGKWNLVKSGDKWVLDNDDSREPVSEVVIEADTAWRLFSKSIRPGDVKENIKIYGDRQLGEVALTMVSVMA